MSQRFLIVDDSSTTRSIVKVAVRNAIGKDVELLEARDGLEALEVLSRSKVDVVLTDVHMPRMSGIELVKALAERPAMGRPVIAVISSDPSEDREAALMKMGVVRFIHKPFRPERLAAFLKELSHAS